MADTLSLGALLGTPGLMGFGAGMSGTVVGGMGVPGLFGALLAQEGGQPMAETGLSPDLMALLAAPMGQGAQPFGQALQLGETDVSLSGMTEVVQILTQTISVMYQQLTIQGGVQLGANGGLKGGTGDLAMALNNLGLPMDEAQALATKIDTMLQLLSQQNDAAQNEVTDATGLAAVLLAAMLNPAQAQTLQVTSVEQVQVQVSVTQVQVSTKRVGWQASATPLAQNLVQAELPPPANAPRIAVTLDAAPTPQVAVSVVRAPEPEVGEATQATAQPVVQLALPVAASAEAETVAQMSVAAQHTPRQVQAVAAPKPLEGTVLYRLTEATPGTPVLSVAAVPQAETALDVQSDDLSSSAKSADAASLEISTKPTDAAASAAMMMATPSATETRDAPAAHAQLAARLHLAAQAQAMQQVQVAIQPMVDNGKGGAVQMILNPPELGKIEVHLKIENGQISGTISAQDAGVVEHLVRELPSLRQSFLDAGLKIADQGLSLMLSQQQPDGQPQQQANPFAGMDEETGRRGAASLADELGEDVALGVSAPAAGRWVSPNQLVDVAA